MDHRAAWTPGGLGLLGGQADAQQPPVDRKFGRADRPRVRLGMRAFEDVVPVGEQQGERRDLAGVLAPPELGRVQQDDTRPDRWGLCHDTGEHLRPVRCELAVRAELHALGRLVTGLRQRGPSWQ